MYNMYKSMDVTIGIRQVLNVLILRFEFKRKLEF